MNLNKLLALLFIFGLSSHSFAGERPLVKVADMYYRQFDYLKAIETYQRALLRDSNDMYVIQKLADSYRLTNNWPSAMNYYAKLVNKDNTEALNKLYYADALRANQKYDSAKVYYKAYTDMVPADAAVKERLSSLDKIAALNIDRGFYNIKNLPINSPYSDFGVSFYKDTGIFFCSDRYAEPYVKHTDNWTHASFLQIYKAFKDDTSGNISKCSLLSNRKGADKKFHEGTTNYNDRMQELYFDRSNYNGRRAFFASDKTVKLKIYRVGWLADQNKWSDVPAEAVPFNDNEYSVGHPCMSRDGKTLYFASDKPGGYGGVDIYMCTREIGTLWSSPVNLGPKVNTAGNDMFPFIADDGTLYFASDGHLGLGGLDIYSTTQNKTGNKTITWAEPVNLGSPINTSSDDFNYIISSDNKRGYFCSNRPGGHGDDDIYSFIKNGVLVAGIVYDKNTGEHIPGAQIVMKEDSAEKGKVTGDSTGEFTVGAIVGKKYKFYATHPGFIPADVTETIKAKPEYIKIGMTADGGITLEVSVVDKKTHNPIPGAIIRLTNQTTKKDVFCTSTDTGKCIFVLDPETDYAIQASKETGEPDTRYLSVSGVQSTINKKAPLKLYSTIELEKVKKGVSIKIENIYYDLNKWFIRPDAAKELDKLVKILKDNPRLEIELASHTDCRGTAESNMQLSSKRAEAAVAYLASQGIAANRMTAAGYGETRLVNKCACEGTVIVPCTDDQHQENRRTEFKILKF